MQAVLRCRTIETQCYVIAAAQTGKHNAKRQSYGHAMVSWFLISLYLLTQKRVYRPCMVDDRASLNNHLIYTVVKVDRVK